MQLNLHRPLAFFDLETTGVNVASDKIIEICIIKILPNGTEQVYEQRINPGMPIPYESSAVHGIFDADVADKPAFKQVAKDIVNFLDNSDLAGYNSNKFDVPMLMEELLRCDIDFDMQTRRMVDVQNIFHKMEQRTLKAAFKFYCNKELENAHSALYDTRATYEILLSQLDKYQNHIEKDEKGNEYNPIKNDVEALYKFSYVNKNVDFAGRMIFNEKGIEVFNFGKHKGKPVVDVLDSEPSYFDWMMKGDFPQYTKKKLTEIRLRRLNTKNAK